MKFAIHLWMSMDLWIKYKPVISKWFITEVAISRTLASITLSSMSATKCATLASNQNSNASTILTRTQSGPIEYNVCILCNNKTYKNVKTRKKIESNERISRILEASNHYSDSNMTSKINQEHFKKRRKPKN